MSARKWPIYTMEVGGTFVVEKPPKRFRSNLHTRANAKGRKVRISRVQKHDPESPLVVTRVA